MKKVILDTDFIINAVKNKIDVGTEIKSLILDKTQISYLDQTIKELKGKPFEALTLNLIKKFKPIKTKQDKSVDNLILDLIRDKKDIIIATQDKNLKEKLKKGKISVITIRQQKYLILS